MKLVFFILLFVLIVVDTKNFTRLYLYMNLNEPYHPAYMFNVAFESGPLYNRQGHSNVTYINKTGDVHSGDVLYFWILAIRKDRKWIADNNHTQTFFSCD